LLPSLASPAQAGANKQTHTVSVCSLTSSCSTWSRCRGARSARSGTDLQAQDRPCSLAPEDKAKKRGGRRGQKGTVSVGRARVRLRSRRHRTRAHKAAACRILVQHSLRLATVCTLKRGSTGARPSRRLTVAGLESLVPKLVLGRRRDSLYDILRLAHGCSTRSSAVSRLRQGRGCDLCSCADRGECTVSSRMVSLTRPGDRR
jgi:hypothetical protein